MLWFIYNILFAVGFLLMLPRFFVRMRRRGGYARCFGHRFGLYEPELRRKLAADPKPVWIHAVSVGELFVAFRFMEGYRARHPGARFVLSTTTSTGFGISEKQMREPDLLIYFPVDFPSISRRVLDLIRPKLLILVECELWPNLIRLAKSRGTPIVLINGRISEHSYRGYSKLHLFTRPLLKQVDLLCAQSESDSKRLLALGAEPGKVHVIGSAKYDLTPTDGDGEAKARPALEAAGIRPDHLILLGGSTWAGEESALLDIYRELKPRFAKLVLVLVPRHAERREEVLREIAARDLSVIQRTAQQDGAPSVTNPPDVLLVDTTGELRSFYACATVIFVGKSLTQHGGQNLIEPAMCAKSIVVGPNMENFQSVMNDFLAADAVIQVPDSTGLQSAVEKLLADPQSRAAYGQRAAGLVREKAGAIARTLELVENLSGGLSGV